MVLRMTAVNLALAALAMMPADAGRFDIGPRDLLLDEPIPIALSGLPPKATVTIRVRGGQDDEWTSNAVFAYVAGCARTRPRTRHSQ
jgi:hypothetical protein